MDNNFNFEIFETPDYSKEEIQQREAEKAVRRSKNARKNLTIKIAGTVIAVIILMLAVLCCYLFTAPSHNPDRLVKKYVNEINNGEWEKAYSRLCFGQSSPIYEDTFVNFCKENPDAIAFTTGKIIDFDIEKDVEAKDSPLHHEIFYSINYVLEDGSNGTFYLSASKTTAKAGKLAKYSIIPSQNCYASLKITVPSATEIRVGDVRFNEPVIENGNYIYNIDYVFARETDIHIHNSFSNDIEEFIELKPGLNTFNFTPEITEECFNKLNEQTKGYITSFYTDVINGKEDFNEYPLSSYYKENGFNTDLEKMKSDVFFGNYTVSNFAVTKAEPKKSFNDINKQLDGTKKNEIEIKYTFSYSYTCTYNDEAGNPVSVDKTDNGYFSVKYILENEWYISDISSEAWF